MLSAVVCVAGLSAVIVFDAAPRFEWKAGEVHKFQVKQETTIAETNAAKVTATTRTKLALTRTWTVTKAEADGSATLTMTITAFRQEMTRPVPGQDGQLAEETTVIDSATPEGAQATVAYLNKPLITCKVDTRGRVSDVTASVPDAAARLQAELPFRVELPEVALAADSKWDRTFTIKLDPPAGSGEKFEATQSCAVEKQDGSRTTIRVGTSLKSPPKEVAELQPLLPWLWEGSVQYDAATKQYLGSKLAVKRDYPNHQGAGSRFAFESSFEESRVTK